MAFSKPQIIAATFADGQVQTSWSYAGDTPTGFVLTVSIPGEYAENTLVAGDVRQGRATASATSPGNTFVIVTPAVDNGAIDDAASPPFKVENIAAPARATNTTTNTTPTTRPQIPPRPPRPPRRDRSGGVSE